VTGSALRDAIAVVEEWDAERASSARIAFEAMGWDGMGDVLLRRYDIQLFVWSTLPRKFIIGPADKRKIVEALAGVLERLGEPAASYAATCRSQETAALLEAWEDGAPGVWDQFRQLLVESGLEPPDTDLLAWGGVMGFDEATAREEVSTALEQAIEAGLLIPGTRSSPREQIDITKLALSQPLDHGDGRSRIEVIHSERIENWVSRVGSERHAILQPITGLLGQPQAVDGDAAKRATDPARWLLDLGTDGIALTQTGALNRSLVREAAERWTGWWDGRLRGPPHQEADVVLLSELHQQLRHLKLLRRSGRRLLTTNRGRGLINDPTALLCMLAGDLLTSDDFRAACAELCVALLLEGFAADWSDPLAEAIRPAISEGGWRSDGEAPSTRDISWAISDFIRPATAAGLLETRELSPRRRDPLIPTEAGRPALIAALRTRATGPRQSPY